MHKNQHISLKKKIKKKKFVKFINLKDLSRLPPHPAPEENKAMSNIFCNPQDTELLLFCQDHMQDI